MVLIEICDGALGQMLEHAAGLQDRRFDGLIICQHRDDCLCLFRGLTGRLRDLGSFRLQRLCLRPRAVPYFDVVPGTDYVPRHVPAHVAQTDKCNFHTTSLVRVGSSLGRDAFRVGEIQERPAAIFFAVQNTDSNIAAVSFPVAVFWFEG